MNILVDENVKAIELATALAYSGFTLVIRGSALVLERVPKVESEDTMCRVTSVGLDAVAKALSR